MKKKHHASLVVVVVMVVWGDEEEGVAWGPLKALFNKKQTKQKQTKKKTGVLLSLFILIFI